MFVRVRSYTRRRGKRTRLKWDSSPEPIASIPGEPEKLLYRDGKLIAFITEDDILSEERHHVFLADGTEIGHHLTWKEAMKLAEKTARRQRR
jgi:hypothetical protein